MAHSKQKKLSLEYKFPYLWIFGEGPVPSGPASEKELHEACAFALKSWQVLPTTWCRLKEWAGHKLASSSITQAVRDRVISLEILSQIQEILLVRFISELDKHHIPYVLLKGNAAGVLVYPHVTSRCGVDLDMGVPKQYIYDAERIALDIGFVQSEWNAKIKRFTQSDMCRRIQVEASHYELGFLARDQKVNDLEEDVVLAIHRDLPHQEPWHETENGDLACYVTLDLHHSLSLSCDLNGTFATSIQVERSGISYRTPSLPWVIFHITEKIYMEGVSTYRKGGHQFADLVRLVVKLNDYEAKLLVEIYSKYKMAIPAFYVLRRLLIEFELKLPNPLMELLENQQNVPDRGVDAYQINDLGDPWSKIWGQR